MRRRALSLVVVAVTVLSIAISATEAGKRFNLPLAYNAEADQKSWEEMRQFFSAVLK